MTFEGSSLKEPEGKRSTEKWAVCSGKEYGLNAEKKKGGND